MKRIVSIATSTAAAVALAVAVGLTGSPASAAPPDAPSNRPVYLALGDSLAAGQASVPATGGYVSTTTRWKRFGFVAQFHDVLRDRLDCGPERPRNPREGCRRLQVVNLSRTGIPGVAGGVTTATVLQPGDQLDRAVAILTERNGDASPRNDVEVVSLTVGGNDIFGPAVAACVPATAACVPTLTTTFADVAARYDRILAGLREAAGPDVPILTTTYDNPLPFCVLGAADPAGATAIGDFVLEGGDIGLGPMVDGFNDVVRDVSARYGATAVDTFGSLGAGDFVGGADCLHPNGQGHRKVAEVFAAALPR
ncbi:GDSL-type esterase/lipase family protein [Cellulomonas sp. ATA003]|uniref:SGNH/GDSL hydrolase family protein n=1 Tax=Cellulomonas sp. ATA003 TaxID=3073064 RepID=UPI00287335D7|nr:GDSL-type esterase/lipase family protein [Cellulomonas sp. ATA003]WNB85797.1 GDSL-type esterase/lipase family protein [Cellulomonas sp. ATA003]